jgi:hypothetical protein
VAAALLVEKNPQMPPCCVRMAALLVKKIRKCRPDVVVAALLVEGNPQMPPCSTSGGITGRKKSANAALLYLCTNGGITGRKKSANAALML